MRSKNLEKIYNFCTRNDIVINNCDDNLVDFVIDNLKFAVLSNCELKIIVQDTEQLNLYKKNHIVIITEKSSSMLFGKPNSYQSNGFKYEKKCPNPLIGVDISLFDNPQFPYRDDRPKCFYDVKVSGQLSSYQAFMNEKIRWKMIVNRILYSGGFIDNVQVLSALNISRTCKQPSWFSVSFAEHIIATYVTSNTIVDPFAGWGARCDAACKLHKNYIGVDANADLVDWHHSKNRNNISLGDAKTFKYDGECSVFICPPYRDVEVYFDSQDNDLSQCDWLKIVMQNVPNAKEYIMVCKVIDEGWEKYIVETKTNKSHFGTNNEYVICVKN